MENKIIDFSIASSCNYNCSYCDGVNKKDVKFLKNKTLENYQETEALLKNILGELKGSWIFNIGGPGEPFLIPNFLKLVKKIIKGGHKIQVVTNFSFSQKELIEFCEITKNNLISFNASLHLEQANLNEFLKKAILINKKIGRKRFSVLSVVRKGKVSQLEKIGKKFREKGIIFTMQLEKGKSGGKYKYLKYSKKELEIIKNFRKNIYSEKDFKLKGRLCWSGCRYFVVNSKGDAWRCYSSKKEKNLEGYLGNFTDKTFKLKKNPVRCPYSYCFCITPINFKLVEGLK